MGLGYPALKRWATLKRPYGTKNVSHPPRLDLGQRLIPQIQQPSRARNDVSILHLEIDATDIDAALADLEDDRVFACGILLEHRLFHERVRVAAGDEVNAVHLRSDLCVADFVFRRFGLLAEIEITETS